MNITAEHIDFRKRSKAVADLSFIQSYYPNGLQWLDKIQHENDTSLQFLRISADVIPSLTMGYIISRKKSPRSIKICTLFIKPMFRKANIAKFAISAFCQREKNNSIDNIYITYNSTRIKYMSIFLHKCEFTKITDMNDIYIENDVESIFQYNL
jgi:hypothetical protein